MTVFYSPDYTLASYAFDTTRKARWVADSLAANPIPSVQLIAPPPLDHHLLHQVHSPEYIQAIATGQPTNLAESQGFRWDPGVWAMAQATNSGAVAAAMHSYTCKTTAGSLSSGLHHARREHGEGFCTFNGLALAATAALAAGAKNILILDLDAHCGGGTHGLIQHDPRLYQLDISVSAFDTHPTTERSLQYLVQAAADYLPAIEHHLAELDHHWPQFDLCLYNAGMDPYENSLIGGLRGITADILAQRERLVFQWAKQKNLPIAFVLAGGYLSLNQDPNELTHLHRLTLSAAVAA